MDGHSQEIGKHHLRYAADLTVRGDGRPERAIQAAKTQCALFFLHFGQSTDLFQDRKSLHNALPQPGRFHPMAEATGQTLPDSTENLVQVGRGKSFGENFQELPKDGSEVRCCPDWSAVSAGAGRLSFRVPPEPGGKL